MIRYNVNVEIKNKPILDPEFTPLLKFNQAFLADAKKPVSIAVERADKQMATTHTYIHGTPEMAAADNYYIDRLVKTLLWMKGGFRVYVTDKSVYDYLNSVYCAGGAREFDWD
ncbi:MAG: ROK family protein, partial [Firmicutes bacterium]|nr:ROK family protein [Bacillota bacterium]